MQHSKVYQLRKYLNHPNSQGFTLLEILVVLAIAAILMAIAAPSWLGWLNTRRIVDAQQEVYGALRLAQSRATQKKARWQFSIREKQDQLEWAIHRAALSPSQVPVWNPLEPAVEFDHDNSTLPQSNNVYYVKFKFTGDVHYRLGRVTFTTSNSNAKRCVIVSTLIGALRKGEGHSTPDSNGRYCY